MTWHPPACEKGPSSQPRWRCPDAAFPGTSRWKVAQATPSRRSTIHCRPRCPLASSNCLQRPPLSGLGLLFLRALGGHLLLAHGKEALVARGEARAESAASGSFLALFSFKPSPASGLPLAPQQKELKAGDRRTRRPAEASCKPTGRRRRALGSCSFRRVACCSRELGVLWALHPLPGGSGRWRGENPPRKRPSPEFYSLRWGAAEEGEGRPKPSSQG